MEQERFRYWVCYRDNYGDLCGEAFIFEFELITDDAVRRAEQMISANEDGPVNILSWKRLQ